VSLLVHIVHNRKVSLMFSKWFGYWLRGRGLLVMVAAALMVFAVSGLVGAADPGPGTPWQVADYLASGNQLLTDFNLLPLIIVAAVIGIAAVIVKRMRSAAR